VLAVIGAIVAAIVLSNWVRLLQPLHASALSFASAFTSSDDLKQRLKQIHICITARTRSAFNAPLTISLHDLGLGVRDTTADKAPLLHHLSWFDAIADLSTYLH
jgi:hypothetical protein